MRPYGVYLGDSKLFDLFLLLSTRKGAVQYTFGQIAWSQIHEFKHLNDGEKPKMFQNKNNVIKIPAMRLVLTLERGALEP